MTNEEEKKISWKYCPGCGKKLPNIDSLRYCTKCGLDLFYIKEHKTLPPRQTPRTYTQAQSIPSSSVSYKPYKEYGGPISDEEILHTKDKELWGPAISIFIPLLSVLIMFGLAIGTIILLVILVSDQTVLINIYYNPLFSVLTTLFTLALIILPIYYTGKYLRNPTLKNRLTLLGFSTKGYDHKGFLKEILIGLGFAIVGLFVFALSSLAIQTILGLVGVRFVESESASNTETLISAMDIFVLVLMILMMLLVVGPCEEIVFRGFMQRGLVRSMDNTWGIIITAFIFASIHTLSYLIYFLLGVISLLAFFIYFIYLIVPFFAIAIMLGLLFRWRNENLIAVVVTHGVYNSIVTVLAFLFLIV